MDLASCRRRMEDAERDAEILKRKASSVRDEGLSGLASEFDKQQRIQVS